MLHELSSAGSAGAWLWRFHAHGVLWLLLRKLLLWLSLMIYWASYVDSSSSWCRFNFSNTKLPNIQWSPLYISINLHPWTCCIASSQSPQRLLLLVLPSSSTFLRSIQLRRFKISTLYNSFVILRQIRITTPSHHLSNRRFTLLFRKAISTSHVFNLHNLLLSSDILFYVHHIGLITHGDHLFFGESSVDAEVSWE